MKNQFQIKKQKEEIASNQIKNFNWIIIQLRQLVSRLNSGKTESKDLKLTLKILNHL